MLTMSKEKILLIIGCVLIGYSLFQPSLNNWSPLNPSPTPVVTVDVDAPSDPELRKLAEVVKDCLLNSDSETRQRDALLLSGLYKDVSTVIAIENNDKVIVNTETIRQINILSGYMLHLDIKGKYEGLGKAAEKLLVSGIGNENKSMTEELRQKSIDCFEALSWACLEGSK